MIDKKVYDILKQKGYSEEQISLGIKNYEKKKDPFNKFKSDMNSYTPPPISKFSNPLMEGERSSDYIKVQIDVKDVLEKLERIYQGDKLMRDSQGNVRYEQDEKNRLFTEKGIRIILSIVYPFLSKVITLGEYKHEEIRPIISDIASEINFSIYINSREIGFDNAEKRKMYGLLVKELTYLVWAAYTRTINAKTREGFNKITHVTQSLSGNDSLYNPLTNAKKPSLLPSIMGGKRI